MKENIYEIEYKYLVDLSGIFYQNYPFFQMEQAYLSTSPVIRIRQQDNQYILTVKGEGLIKHIEYELPLSCQQYQNLKTKTEGIIISKKRYFIPYRFNDKNYTIELDIFEKQLSGLVLAEVEFSSEEEAANFEPPYWFVQNVTKDPKYHNSYLSQYGFEEK